MSQDSQLDLEMERVKEEPIWDESIGGSEAAARAGLYADHDVKDELVLGPVVLQSADGVYTTPDGKGNTCNQITLAAVIPSTGSTRRLQNNLECWDFEKTHLNRSVKEVLNGHLLTKDGKLSDSDTNASKITHEQIAETPAHIENKYECDVCGRKFRCKYALRRHLRIHSEKKPFSCDFCGRQFRQSSALIRHTHIHTGKKPHSCKICGRRFIKKSDLIVHTRIHTGAKPYTCNTCGAQFRHESSVKRHMRTHKDGKPYCCDTCGKYYAQRNTLIRHTRIHKGLKPHPSTRKCGRIFVEIAELDGHEHVKKDDVNGICRKLFRDNCMKESFGNV